MLLLFMKRRCPTHMRVIIRSDFQNVKRFRLINLIFHPGTSDEFFFIRKRVEISLPRNEIAVYHIQGRYLPWLADPSAW